MIILVTFSDQLEKKKLSWWIFRNYGVVVTRDYLLRCIQKIYDHYSLDNLYNNHNHTMIVKVFVMTLFIFAICSQKNKEGNNELLSMKRNGCLLTTRNYLHTKQDNLEQILKGVYQSEMKQYLQKLHAALIQKCEKEISESEAQEFYAQNNDDFDIKNFFYLVSDASFVDILSDLTLTWEEKEIIEFSKAFDKHHNIEQVDEQEQEF